MSEHVKGDFIKMQCTPDLVVYYKPESKNLIKICATYPDDTCHDGNKIYKSLSEETVKKIICKDQSWDSMKSTGLKLEATSTRFKAYKHGYASKPAKRDIHRNFASFPSQRARLAGDSNSRPDPGWSVTVLISTTQKVFWKETLFYIKTTNCI